MKKTLLLVAAITFSLGINAQDNKTGTQTTTQQGTQSNTQQPDTREQGQMGTDQQGTQQSTQPSRTQQPGTQQSNRQSGNRQSTMTVDHIMMKNGRMMVVKSAVSSSMDTEMTLSDGTVVSSTGVVKTPDGRTMIMKDGDMIDMNGQTLKSEKMRDHMMLRGGKVVMNRNGARSMVEHDMILENGTVVSPSGIVRTKDGKTMQLREGEKVDMSGMIIKMDKNKKNGTVKDKY